MADQIEATQSDFIKAVNGWKQSVSIMRRLTASLEFMTAEITRVSKEHPFALGDDKDKAAKYQEAVYAMDAAHSYLSAMDS